LLGDQIIGMNLERSVSRISNLQVTTEGTLIATIWLDMARFGPSNESLQLPLYHVALMSGHLSLTPDE